MELLSYEIYNNEENFNIMRKNEFENIQNFIPIYKKLFDISNCIINKINLKKKNHLKNIDLSNNCFMQDNKKIDFFIKYSPIINPIKYVVGEYKIENFYLPKTKSSNNDDKNINYNKKINNVNNSSYIDSFFNYLSSILLNNYKINNCIDFYGSFLLNQKKFNINFFDDIDVLLESDFFYKNQNKLFEIRDNLFEEIFNSNTKKNKKKIIINNNLSMDINLDNLSNIEYSDLFYKKNNDISFNNCIELYKNDMISKKDENDESSGESSDESSCESSDESSGESSDESSGESSDSDKSCDSSSELSDVSSNEPSDGYEIYDISNYEIKNLNIDYNTQLQELYSESEPESDSDSELSYCSDYVNNNFILTIYNFPTQTIFLEKLNTTLNDYLSKNKPGESEWESILFQIIITLVIYQKIFNFTHNDLHTNNVMIKETDEEYIYYKFDNIYYKIPTFGKIYKIIDFGRSIYYYKDKLFCSDHFEKHEDAYSQYNFAHIYNNKKRKIIPNMSFDLCRLGCSLVEYIIDDFKEFKNLKNTKSDYKKIIYNWLIDDNGKNILYKSNGDERYEDFDLYKNITKRVHKHVPKLVIKNEIFDDFIIKNIEPIDNNIIDIDNIEKMYN